MKKTIGICLIGAGRAGMIHAHNFMGKVSNAKIIAVVDPNIEVAKKAAEELEIEKYYLDYNEALKDEEIGAVIVVTPTKFHHEIVIAAANAKKHILCEKPMAMNATECDEMIEAANRNQVKLQIGFMRRFDENFKRAKEIIDSGAIGDVVLVKSLTRGPSIPKPWMYDITVSNGPLAEVNSHDIDTLRWLTNSEVKSLYAVAGNYRCLDAKAEFPDFYDTVLMNMTFENGMLGCIDGAQGVGYGYDARVDILGTKGCLLIGEVQDRSCITLTKENGKVSDIVNSWTKLFKDAYVDEDMSFVQCILNDTEPEVTGIDGKMAVMIVKAGNQSIVSKKIVEL